MVPVLGLHHDEQFYLQPEMFIPERFNAENSAGKNQINRPYLPFGDGPRHCIAMRLGKMQATVGLLWMLKEFEYEIEPSQRDIPITFDPSVFVLSPKQRFLFCVKKRSKQT